MVVLFFLVLVHVFDHDGDYGNNDNPAISCCGGAGGAGGAGKDAAATGVVVDNEVVLVFAF